MQPPCLQSQSDSYLNGVGRNQVRWSLTSNRSTTRDEVMASTAQKITFRNFRVVITGNASALSLLRMAENEYSARCIAQHAADRNGSAAVWVER